ncbi:MAG: hypothetical protein IT376_01610 [Polyangiaceae bacterium]|nr:hypothetical protein [Polyangiaceae bacterium]
MLARIWVIAFNTYREAVRARVLHGLFGLAIATAAYSLIVGVFALRETLRVISDLGAASVSLYSVVVAVVLTATSLHRELELKTIFPILARPISRSEYLVGKFFGTMLLLLTFIAGNVGLVLLALGAFATSDAAAPAAAAAGASLVAALIAWRVPRARTLLPIPWAAAVLGLGIWLSGGAPDDQRVLLGGACLTLAEVTVVTGIALVFASFSSPFLTAVFSLGVFVVGRSADTLAKLPVKVFGAAIQELGRAASHVVPNLMVYVPPRTLLTGESGQALLPYLGLAAAQAAAWSLGLLAVASLIFRRRDFL